jgi:hypothetical protein
MGKIGKQKSRTTVSLYCEFGREKLKTMLEQSGWKDKVSFYSI